MNFQQDPLDTNWIRERDENLGTPPVIYFNNYVPYFLIFRSHLGGPRYNFRIIKVPKNGDAMRSMSVQVQYPFHNLIVFVGKRFLVQRPLVHDHEQLK